MRGLVFGMLLAGVFAAAPASAQVVLSDGFEGDALGAPQPSLNNWNVTSGSVDVVGGDRTADHQPESLRHGLHGQPLEGRHGVVR